MKILTIGGSNSRNSINRALAFYTAGLFKNADITKVDISNIELPLYSIDKEIAGGIPNSVLDFAKQIDETDLITLSLAENNGSFNVGLKNLLDWTSRIKDRKIFNNKPMLLMSTSPGARGGATILENAKNLFPYAGAIIKGTFSLPDFYQNFDYEKGITNQIHFDKLKGIIQEINQHDTIH